MKKHAIGLFALLILFALCQARIKQVKPDEFPALQGPYLGQKPPGMTPEIFAPGIVSTAEFEFAGTFSPDGKEYFFTRRPDYGGSENRILLQPTAR